MSRDCSHFFCCGLVDKKAAVTKLMTTPEDGKETLK